MLTQELSVEIRVLARQGMSIQAIAQQLRVSRNTVCKYLRNPGLPIYPSPAARPTKLDPFKPYLQARIQAAKPHWIPATVLLRELREHGYTGGSPNSRPGYLLCAMTLLAPSSVLKRRPVNRCRSISPSSAEAIGL